MKPNPLWVSLYIILPFYKTDSSLIQGECEFCVYHVKQAFKASSSARSCLQSSFSSAGSEATRARIMQKIAPKSKVKHVGNVTISYAKISSIFFICILFLILF